MRIIKATLEHLDLLTPLFVKYREFYGQLPYPDSSRSFLEKRLKRDESVIYLALPADMGPWIYGILPAGGAGLQTSGLYALIDFVFLHIGRFAVWLPQVMLGAYLVEIPLFAGLAVVSYTGHRGS